MSEYASSLDYPTELKSINKSLKCYPFQITENAIQCPHGWTFLKNHLLK